MTHDSGRHGPDEDAGPTWLLIAAMLGIVVLMVTVATATVLLV